MYAILAEHGFISHADLETYRVKGGVCQGHVDMKWCPGVDFSAGSLGMGLSFGLGCALAARLDGSDRQAWVMLGDGEVQEGSVWEAAMAAKHHNVSNLKASWTSTAFRTTTSASSKWKSTIWKPCGPHLAGRSSAWTGTT